MVRNSWIRRALVLGCMMPALAGLGTVAQVSSASAHAAPPQHTLRFLLKNVKATLIDLPPRGLSVGDERLGHAALFNAQGTTRVGTLNFVLTVTNTHPKPGVIALKAAETFTFQDGSSIEVAGVSQRPSLTSLPPNDVYAITGGTGKFVGAKGVLKARAVAPGVLSEVFVLS